MSGQYHRGVGIHYTTGGLTTDSLSGWLFENVGDVRIIVGGCRSENLERTLFFSWAETTGKIRIGIWTVLPERDAWSVVNMWASRLAFGTRCQLTTESIDCYEFDEVRGGYFMVHHSKVAGKVQENVATGKMGPKKPERTH